MLKKERHQYILNRLSENYRIYITALSQELGVADDTLRRDLIELDEQGLTAPDRKEAMVKRLMMKRAQKRIVLADSHKLNKAKDYVIALLGDVDYLVTEDVKVESIKEHWARVS